MANETPELPLTEELMTGLPKAPKGYVGPEKLAPVIKEIQAKKATAEEELAQSDIRLEKAKREEKATEAELRKSFYEQEKAKEEAMPQRAALKQAREEISSAKFEPTRDTVKDIAGLFSLMGVVGMVVGKKNAMQGMYAMNGMMEGHIKGRKDLVKQQAVEFDKNFKVLQAKVESAKQELEEAQRIRMYDQRAGEEAIAMAVARSESPFIKEMVARVGIQKTINTLADTKKTIETMVKMQNELQGKAEDRALKEELLRLRSGASGKLSEKAKKEVGNNINLMGGLSDLSRMVEKVKDETTVFGVAGYLPQAASQRIQSSEARQTLALLQNITSAELKLRSGATVTVAEFARQRGFLPLETDSPEAIQDKITSMYDAIEAETGGIASRTKNAEISNAVSSIERPLAPSFRKEATGQEEPSPTKEKTVVKSGVVQSGPNKGKRVVVYSDGTQEYQ